jgi:hypothetical protein
MKCHAILRVAALAAVLEMTGFAIAQNAAEAPAEGGSVKAAPVRGGGGGAAAPQPGQPAAPSAPPSAPGAGRQPSQPPAPAPQPPPRATPGRGGQPGQPPPPSAPGRPGAGMQPGQPPAPSLPRNPGDIQNNNARDRHGRRAFILPGSLYGWAPYSWWYNGNSYWDGYDGSSYSDRDTGSSDYVPPAVPPDTAIPTDEQAKALNQLEGMPDYRRALTEVKQAQADYDAASARVLDKVKEKADYQALVKERDRAEDRVEALQAGARIPSPERVTPVAQRKLEVSAKITRMEQQAINADPQARSAKAKLQEATDRVTAMRQQARDGAAR